MALTPYPLNLTAFSNVPALNISIPTDPVELLTSLPQTANTYSDGLYGLFFVWVLVIMLYLILSNKTPFGDFQYSDARAIAIAFLVVSIFAISMLELSLFTEFRHIAQFIILAMMFSLYVSFIEAG